MFFVNIKYSMFHMHWYVYMLVCAPAMQHQRPRYVINDLGYKIWLHYSSVSVNLRVFSLPWPFFTKAIQPFVTGCWNVWKGLVIVAKCACARVCLSPEYYITVYKTYFRLHYTDTDWTNPCAIYRLAGRRKKSQLKIPPGIDRADAVIAWLHRCSLIYDGLKICISCTFKLVKQNKTWHLLRTNDMLIYIFHYPIWTIQL